MYVKVWALSNPVLPGKFALYDEAQDADPCIAGVVLAQKHMQLIAVGDECQAIYGWRGATDAMKNWPAANRVSLTKSFRFGQAVADQANRFLGRLDAPLRIQGFEKLNSTVGTVDLLDADAVLCRTNASVISTALSIHEARKFAIVGGAEAIRKFAEAAEALQTGRSAAWHADLGAFKRWDDVVDYVNNDAGGADLRSMVNIIEDFGVQTIFDVADKAVDEKRAPAGTLTLSTAHKAKGREWDRVVIADDFTPQADPETGETREPGRAELMLMYVAVTRAKQALDCSALSWV
jgi:superfamily I DNA/RNA helicase